MNCSNCSKTVYLPFSIGAKIIFYFIIIYIVSALVMDINKHKEPKSEQEIIMENIGYTKNKEIN